MARRPPYKIPTDGDLDGQPQIESGEGRAPKVQGPTRPWEPPLKSLDGAMELSCSLLNSPLPPTPSAAPHEGRGGTPHIVRFPIIIEFVRYDALMHELRDLGVRSDFVTDEVWNRYHEYWASDYFKARSEKASHKRKSENARPSTGPSKHTGGTQSFRNYEDILALDKDEDDEAKLVRRYEEHTQATSDQPIDEEQLYYDAMGGLPKGACLWARVTCQEEEEICKYRQLGLRMDLGTHTSQAPPPPQPWEHHHLVRMDMACTPQQQHDDDDRDNLDSVDKEHLGDKS
ncbi:hypothetical protein Scep_007442 [Stephania cephalantha]|uniref:Uncharacterized protein n=1 Tax=Stephania cephalantha TaxID=152367 RepID=A0AAP0KB58_9MAGN